MKYGSELSIEALPPIVGDRVDRACDQFESVWKTGGRPRIEDYLGQSSEPERSLLLSELIALELTYRTRRGDVFTRDDYCVRFPKHTRLVNQVIGESLGSIHVFVSEHHQPVCAGEFSAVVELGRRETNQSGSEPKHLEESGICRMAIAELDEVSVSRRHARVEVLPGDKVRITNLSAKNPIAMADPRYGGELSPGSSRDFLLPVLFTIGSKTVRIERSETDSAPLQSLAEPPLAPSRQLSGDVKLALRTLVERADTSAEPLVRWLQVATDVLQSAASSTDFFQKAAGAVVDLIGLDVGHTLLLENGEWNIQCSRTADGVTPASDRQVMHRVLERVRAQKRTFWHIPSGSQTLAYVEAVVAAPILNPQGEVIGSLYGERGMTHAGGTAQVTTVEARLVELLACGVAAGLARLEQQRVAIATQVLFEQFFTPQLSRHLVSHPDLLTGRDSEVTLLFCDIRGFSRISRTLGPTATMDWIGDVMGELSECVIAHRGVLVDYVGDELIAMWGAPEVQQDHAKLACRAALDMLHAVPRLNQRWQPVLRETMVLGMGINTGPARVGNTGSHLKFKYGPLGNTVNLASRVQGATKYLRSPVLITGSTHAELDATFHSRRLCKVQVVNINEPVWLYELAEEDRPGWPELKQSYEKALGEFEQKNYSAAAGMLGNLLVGHPNDGPTLVLLARAVNSIVEPLDQQSVWELPGK